MPQLMWINGQRVPSVTGELFDIHDPATEQLVDQVPMANEQDARLAIERVYETGAARLSQGMATARSQGSQCVQSS